MIEYPLVAKCFYDYLRPNAIDITYRYSYLQCILVFILAKIRLLQDLKQFHVKDQHRVRRNRTYLLVSISQAGGYEQLALSSFPK